MQIFTNGKRRFHCFMELYVIHRKKSRCKNLIIVPLEEKTYPGSTLYTVLFKLTMHTEHIKLYQGFHPRKITRSLEVPYHEILSAQHLSLYEKRKFFQLLKGKS